MKKLVILFYILCLVPITANAGPGECVEFAGVNGKKYCYSTGGGNPIRRSFSYCHAQGYHLASAHELCDISSADADRAIKNTTNGCKNLVGITNLPARLFTSSLWEDGRIVSFSKDSYKLVADYSDYSGRYAVCYTGECAEGFIKSGDECIGCNPSSLSGVTNELCCTAIDGTWQNGSCTCTNGRFWDDESKKCTFCQYRYTLPSDFTEVYGNGSECRYNLVVSGNNESYSLTPDSTLTCPAGQYCFLDTGEDCSWKLMTTGPVYGHCLNLNEGLSSNPRCMIWREQKQITIERVVGCHEGDYCRINWSDEKGTTNISGSSSGILYGVCESGD